MSNTETQSVINLPDLPGIEKGWELMHIDERAATGKFTGERIAKDRARLAVIQRAIAEGMSLRAIASSQGCSTNTILAIKRSSGRAIDTLKEELGRDALDVGRLALERIRDEIQDMPKASLPIIVGIMVDKAQLLTGAPTMRIQHDHSATVADVSDYIASLPSCTPIQPVGERDGSGQKAAGSSELQDVAKVVEAGLVEAVVDSQSTVSVQVSEVPVENCTDFGRILGDEVGQVENRRASTRTPAQDAGARSQVQVGGGGVRRSQGGPNQSTGEHEDNL